MQRLATIHGSPSLAAAATGFVAVAALLPTPEARAQQPPAGYHRKAPPPPSGPPRTPPGYAPSGSKPRGSPSRTTAPPPPRRTPRRPGRPNGPGYHQHDGFFLRLSAGGGYVYGIKNTPAQRFKLHGVASGLSFAIGGTVADHLMVHADLFGGVAPQPSLSLDGKDAGSVGALQLSGLGAGITYYLMPANVYLSASVGLGVGTIEASPDELETNPGVAVDFLVGKEWWVGANWGIGAALQLKYFRLPSDDAPFDAFAPALLFSATYN